MRTLYRTPAGRKVLSAAKTMGLDDQDSSHVSNIKRITIVQPRELSRRRKLNGLPARGIDLDKANRFHKFLENQAGKRLQIKINDNRSTMLSVKWEPDRTKVSLHHMFLGAPQNVMVELACYLRGGHKSISPSIKAYIEAGLQKLDYSSQMDLGMLDVAGNHYNLKEIFDDLNEEYFGGQLRLHLTWFGKNNPPTTRRITFGLYYDPLKLIKISRFLDNPRIPKYFLEFVVYHEMVHSVCPAYVDERGTKHIHGKKFREREAEYRHFQQAQKWMRKNLNSLVDDKYGWSQ